VVVCLERSVNDLQMVWLMLLQCVHFCVIKVHNDMNIFGVGAKKVVSC